MEDKLLNMPKEIIVGYQQRKDTYEDKLGFITFKENDVLKKEKTWTKWRDKSIEPDTFKNEPTEGFVLNKNVGGYNYGWHSRQAKIRVYDPRGFEIEITVENLLYILMYNSCIQGKGLEGEYVYVWDKQELVLMPYKSPDCQKAMEYNQFLNDDFKISTKELVIGTTYLDKEMNKLTYLGHFDNFENKRINKIDKKGRVHMYSTKKSKKHFFYNESKSWNKIVPINTMSRLKGIDGKKTTAELDELYKELERYEGYYLYPYKMVEPTLMSKTFNDYFNRLFNSLSDNKIGLQATGRLYTILFIDENKKPLHQLCVRKTINQNGFFITMSLNEFVESQYKDNLYFKTDDTNILFNEEVFRKTYTEEDKGNSMTDDNITETIELLKNKGLKDLLSNSYIIQYERDTSKTLLKNKEVVDVFNYNNNFGYYY